MKTTPTTGGSSMADIKTLVEEARRAVESLAGTTWSIAWDQAQRDESLLGDSPEGKELSEAKTTCFAALDALAEAHQAEVARLTRERDAAFAMSRCECSSDEACANLVRLTRENEGLARINAELLDQMHHFANADQRLWDESQRDPESFIRWVRSRAAHLLAKFTDRAALAGASGAQEGERT